MTDHESPAAEPGIGSVVMQENSSGLTLSPRAATVTLGTKESMKDVSAQGPEMKDTMSFVSRSVPVPNVNRLSASMVSSQLCRYRLQIQAHTHVPSHEVVIDQTRVYQNTVRCPGQCLHSLIRRHQLCRQHEILRLYLHPKGSIVPRNRRQR